MARVELTNASFSYPVFQLTDRSFKAAILKKVPKLKEAIGLQGNTGAKVVHDGGKIHVQALEDVTFSLKDGDRFGLIGHNGAGKSTLLRVVAGLAHPQTGKVVVQGRVVSLIARGLGINAELSGYANIELPLRLLGATNEEVRRAQAEIPEFTGLGEFIHLPVRTYSEGMRTRLAFALCTSIHADVLVLDEWLAGGDADFHERAQDRLKTMLERTRIVVLATHSMALTKSVCTVAGWMDGGRMIQVGDPKAIITAYQEAAHASATAGIAADHAAAEAADRRVKAA